MKYKNIPYEKKDINVVLKFIEDFKISIRNEKKETEIVKYSKDSIIGSGIATLEIIQTRQDNKIKHYLFFKSFQMNPNVNIQHVFYDKNILNDEKIGIGDERLKSLNIAYEVSGKIIDITNKERVEIDIDHKMINKIKKHIEIKLQKNNTDDINIKTEEELKKEVDKTKKEKQSNATEVK
jgi:hypothetical protein